MQSYTWLENLTLGALILIAILWMQAGARSAFQRSKNTPAAWGSVLLPLIIVVLFVVFLIMMV